MHSEDVSDLEDEMVKQAAEFIRQLGDPDYPELAFHMSKLQEAWGKYQYLVLVKGE